MHCEVLFRGPTYTITIFKSFQTVLQRLIKSCALHGTTNSCACICHLNARTQVDTVLNGLDRTEPVKRSGINKSYSHVYTAFLAIKVTLDYRELHGSRGKCREALCTAQRDIHLEISNHAPRKDLLFTNIAKTIILKALFSLLICFHFPAGMVKYVSRDCS